MVMLLSSPESLGTRSTYHGHGEPSKSRAIGRLTDGAPTCGSGTLRQGSKPSAAAPSGEARSGHGSEKENTMLAKLLKRFRREDGQGMTEYIIIVALIAIAAIGVVTIFGDNIRDLFAGATNALAGEQKVKPGTEKARESHTKSKSLKTFGEDNKGSNQ
jgi:pilus assembly protein Flp/PilA